MGSNNRHFLDYLKEIRESSLRMRNKAPTILDVIEAFLTGLSCLIGGDQFYIFISQTNASVAVQYYILVSVATATFIASLYLNHSNDIFLNGSYLFYVTLTASLVLISYNDVKSQIIISFITILIAIVLTFFIIQACAKFSDKKFLLPSFIAGLFAARLVPNICWIIMRRKFDDYESQSHYVCIIVSIFRLSIGLKVIFMKIINKNFGWKYRTQRGKLEKLDNNAFGMIHFSVAWDMFKRVRISLIPYCNFIVSIALYTTFPPTIYTSYFNYSPQLISSVSTMEMSSHLLGLCLGVIVPISITSNYYHYYTIVFVIYLVYLISIQIVYNLAKSYSHYVLYSLIIISSFLLGYLCTYSLTILINTTFLQTCMFEEYKTKPCCGEKINNECYCKLPSISDPGTVSDGKRFDCSTLYCKDKSKLPSYAVDGKTAIIIMTDSSQKDNLPQCKENCSEECCQKENGCCIKIIGIFMLDTVTTSSCTDCQLTIRLEARCSKECPKCCGSGEQCPCSTDTGKCCCLCVKCCDKSCTGQNGECCPRVCKCTSKPCKCNEKADNFVRVFIATKTKSPKCCIKEIKPNSSLDFIGANKDGDFDIRDLFISDCCHTSLRVDIHCTVKNNFYRLTPIDYQKKPTKPLSLKLCRKDGECCKAATPPKCCCAESQFVKVCLDYNLPKCKQTKTECSCGGSCSKNCKCCTEIHNGKCCCCVTLCLNIDSLTSFCKRVDLAKVRLVCISISCIAFFTLLLVLLITWIRSSNISPYRFNPFTTFRKVKSAASKNKFNSDDEISRRLTNLTNALNPNHPYEAEVSNVMLLFSRVFDKGDYEKLQKYVDKKSDKFFSSSSAISKTYNLEMIKLCYYTGLLFGYFTKIFARFQKFFVRWEEAWQNEFFDYRKLLSSIINNISQKSKFALSALTELTVNELRLYQMSRDRKVTWSDVFGELDRYTTLYEEEMKYSAQWLPFRLDHRLSQYVERWRHRLGHIREWTEGDKSVFDWKPFLNNFSQYEQWFNDFYPYLVKFSDNITLPTKVLNKEIGVFVNYKLK